MDIGSNSVHLLVAAVVDHRLEPLADESVFLRLGERLDEAGYLGADARNELAATLAGFAETARSLGAGEIAFIGTEPLRRAADGPAAIHEVERATGVPLHVVDHADEAILNLLGVTGGRPVTGDLLVVDIGGGSSEFVLVGPGREPMAMGLQLGASRLTAQLVSSDPPTSADIARVKAEAGRLLEGAPDARPGEIVAIGGTASNLLRVVPGASLDGALTRRRMTVALAMLVSEPSAQAADRYGFHPVRARTLPAGAAIIEAVLERYGVDGLRVSEASAREGAVLAALRAGHAWRDRLRSLASGWIA